MRKKKPRQDERAVVLVEYSGCLLMGRMNTKRRASNGTAHPLGLPGGSRRSRELPVEAAQRELKEELDKKLALDRFRFRGKVVDKSRQRLFHIFSVALHEEEYQERIPPHHEFIGDLEWYPLDHIPWEDMLRSHRRWLPVLLLGTEEVNLTL